MRLQQITCGHFVADDGTTQNIKHNRMTELMDILEEVEGKAIIWAHWQRDVRVNYSCDREAVWSGIRGPLLWQDAT